jgi:hypothetical protein
MWLPTDEISTALSNADCVGSGHEPDHRRVAISSDRAPYAPSTPSWIDAFGLALGLGY